MGEMMIWFNGSVLLRCSLLLISSFPFLGNGGSGRDLALAVEQRSNHVRKEAIMETFEFAGEVIDCVDIYKQPALDHPLLKNHTIQMKPTSYPMIPRKWRTKKINVSMEEGLKPWLLPRSCPKGSIPIPRMRELNSSDTASIRRYLAQRRIKDKKQTSVHEITINADHLYGARAVINLQNPTVEGRSEFSLAQIWVAKKDAMNQMTTLEAGWMVHPRLYRDRITRLFTFWTNNNYRTLCYNLQCPGFVRINDNINLGMPLVPTSTIGGTQHEIELEIFQEKITKNWWIKMNGAPLGYWPSHIVPQLRGGADRLDFGGEVINKAAGGRHTTTQMGSGHFSIAGYGISAYFRNILVARDPSTYTLPTNSTATATHPSCYDIGLGGRPYVRWGHYFFYGGPGRSILCP